jgi:hypothetical protein
LESWRIGLERREVRRVGFALAAHVEAPSASLSVSTPTGCVKLEGIAVQSIWIEQPAAGRKRLELTTAFARRKEPCRQALSRLMLLDARSQSSTARVEGQTATFTLALPDRGDRLRVALGSRTILRLDLQGATAEREALATVSP